MPILTLIKISLNSLLVNKGRTILTMLGIIIGISAVIIIISVGAGAQSLIFNQIKKTGSNLIGVLPGHREGNEPPAAAFGIAITTLKYEDSEIIKDPINVPHAVASTPYVKGIATMVYGNKTHDSNFTGVSADYPKVEDATLEYGDFFGIRDEKGLNKVAVLGSLVKEKLFGTENPVGKSIRIKNTNFIVIGVFNPRGSASFQNQDDQVFIPITTAQKVMLGINYVGFIRVKVDNAKYVQQTMDDVTETLRIQHRIKNPDDDDFFVGSQEMMLSVLGGITDIVKYLLATIAGISLLVGGIGIMNIMFVSVNERTREIGLRKAIGARSGQIKGQFLAEAVTITLIAGIFGIIIGVFISFLVALIARYLGYDWDFSVSISSILLAFGFCTMIGLIFGYYPAKKASTLDPIEALRYE